MKNIMTIVLSVFLLALNNFAADNAPSKAKIQELTEHAAILKDYDANWLDQSNNWEYRGGAIVSKPYASKSDASKAYGAFQQNMIKRGFKVPEEVVLLDSRAGGVRIKCPPLPEKVIACCKLWNERTTQMKTNIKEHPDLANNLYYVGDALVKLNEKKEADNAEDLNKLIKEFGLKHIVDGYSQIWPNPGNNGFVLITEPFIRGVNKKAFLKQDLSEEQINSIIAFIEKYMPDVDTQVKKEAINKRRNL